MVDNGTGNRSQRFGVHPRRARENAIIDECEGELVDSGVLASRSWVEKLPMVRILGRMAPSLLKDEKLRENLVLLIGIISAIIVFIIVYPLLAQLGGTVSDIFSGKPKSPRSSDRPSLGLEPIPRRVLLGQGDLHCGTTYQP